MRCDSAACGSGTHRQARPLPALGDPVVLLHGSLSSSAVWRPLRDDLSPLFPTAAPDLIGYGTQSAWPDGRPFSAGDELAALASELPCCGAPFHLVGYSYGGVLALLLALKHPARVRTLTLIEPVFFNALRYAEDWQAYRKFAFARDDFDAALTSGDVDGAMRGFVDFWTGTGAWDALPAAARAGMRSMAPKVRLDWQAAFAADPGAPGLQDLGPRTLLLYGGHSPAPMQRLVGALHTHMPGSRRVAVGGADHRLPLTHGADLSDAVLAHLHADAERRLH